MSSRIYDNHGTLKGEDVLNPTALRIIALLQSRPGHPPKHREMCKLLGLSPNGLRTHLLRLRKLGLLTFADFSAGTVVLKCRLVLFDRPPPQQ